MSGENSITPNVIPGSVHDTSQTPVAVGDKYLTMPVESLLAVDNNSETIKYSQVNEPLTQEQGISTIDEAPSSLSEVKVIKPLLASSKFTYAQSLCDESEQNQSDSQMNVGTNSIDYRHSVGALYHHGLSTEPNRNNTLLDSNGNNLTSLEPLPTLRHASSFNKSTSNSNNSNLHSHASNNIPEISIEDELSIAGLDFKLPNNLKNNPRNQEISQSFLTSSHYHEEDEDDEHDNDDIENGPVNVSLHKYDGSEQSSFVLTGGMRITRGGGADNALVGEDTNNSQFYEGDEDEFDDYEIGPMHFDQKSVKDMLTESSSPKKKQMESEHSVTVDVEVEEDNKATAMSEVRTTITESQFSTEKQKKGREDCCECILM